MIITYDAVPATRCLLHDPSPTLRSKSIVLMMALLSHEEGAVVTADMMLRYMRHAPEELLLLALRQLKNEGLLAFPDGMGIHEEDARLVLRIEPLARTPEATSLCWCPALAGQA